MRELEATATTAEVIWTVATTCALLVNGWALWDAIWDWNAVRQRRTNGSKARLWVIARANVRREVVQCFIQSLFTALGVASILAPAAYQPDTGELGILQRIAPGVFVLVAIILAINSIFDRADRHVLLRLIRRARTTPGAGV